MGLAPRDALLPVLLKHFAVRAGDGAIAVSEAVDYMWDQDLSEETWTGVFVLTLSSLVLADAAWGAEEAIWKF